MKAKYKKIILGAAAVLIAAALIRLLFLESTLKYFIILLLILIIAYLVWEAFIKNSRKELKASEQEKQKLESELAALKEKYDELSRSRLNVTGISPILHLSVLEIDTSFTRSYERDSKNGIFSFVGALRADICAEYGIRLEDVRFRYEKDSDTLQLANFQPGLISYSKKQITWDIARSYHKRSLLGMELAPADDEAAKKFTAKMKEHLRAELEKEIDDRKIEEFDWLAPIVRRQVCDAIRIALGRPALKIEIRESQDGSEGELFSDFESLSKRLSAPKE